MNYLEEHTGKFYFPDVPNQKFEGVVTIDYDMKILLTLTDEDICFSGDNKWLMSSLPHGGYVFHGQLNNGAEISLLGANPTTFVWPEEVMRPIFIIQTLIIGYHFATEDDISFDNFQFGCTALSKWLENGTICTQIDNNFKIIVSGVSSSKIPEKAYVSFQFETPQSLRDIREKQYAFVALIELATGKRQGVYEQSANVDGKIVRVYGTFSREKEDGFVPTRKMLFIYKDISDNVDNRLKNWYDFFDKHITLVGWYFTLVIGADNKYPTIATILHLIQFLEGYHRLKNRMPKVSKADKRIWDKKTKNLLSRRPRFKRDVEFRERVQDLLKHGHRREPSLRSRLCDLTSENPYFAIPDKLLTSARNIRDGLSHMLVKINKQGNNELSELRKKLTQVVKYCLLTELLFDEVKKMGLIISEGTYQ